MKLIRYGSFAFGRTKISLNAGIRLCVRGWCSLWVWGESNTLKWREKLLVSHRRRFSIVYKQGVNEFVFHTMHLPMRHQKMPWLSVPWTYLGMDSLQKAGEYWCYHHLVVLKYPLCICTFNKFFHNSFCTGLLLFSFKRSAYAWVDFPNRLSFIPFTRSVCRSQRNSRRNCLRTDWFTTLSLFLGLYMAVSNWNFPSFKRESEWNSRCVNVVDSLWCTRCTGWA